MSHFQIELSTIFQYTSFSSSCHGGTLYFQTASQTWKKLSRNMISCTARSAPLKSCHVLQLQLRPQSWWCVLPSTTSMKQTRLIACPASTKILGLTNSSLGAKHCTLLAQRIISLPLNTSPQKASSPIFLARANKKKRTWRLWPPTFTLEILRA